MKHSAWVFCVTCCTAALALNLPGRLAAKEQPPLRWGADAEGGAPYIFKDPANPERNIGYEVDLASALARELGRPIEFKQYDFKNLVPGLNRGDFDFAMNGLEITADRLDRVRFSKPYYVYKLQLAVRATETRLASLADCKRLGSIVGTLEDTAAARLLDQLGISKRIYDGQVEPYQDLTLGRIDAVLFDGPIAQYYAQKSIVTLNPPEVKFVGQVFGRGYYAIAFARHNEDLAKPIDAALDRLMTSGELRRILRKWNLWNASQEELLPPGAFFEDTATVSGPEIGARAGFFKLLLEGAWMTIQLTLVSFALAILVALPIALMRLYGPWPARVLATAYVEFFRGIPVLLLLVFLYFGLPTMSKALELDAFTVGVLAFGLNYAAYEAEIYRAGFSAIAIGQWEAAASLGMSRTVTFRRIILPQAIRIILPPMTNDFVALFKDTSVVSIIALEELSKRYQILAKSTGDYLTIGLATAALYLLMSVPLGHLSRYLEKRWSQNGE